MTPTSTTSHHAARTAKPHRKRRHIGWYVVGSLLVLLIAFRLYLPTLVLNVLNKRFEHMGKDYSGHIEAINIRLWRGAYIIKELKIIKVTGQVPIPFVTVQEMDLAVEWASVWKGQVVARIIATHPVINFIAGNSKETSQSGKGGPDWKETVKHLVPININTFTIRDGEVHYRDFSTKPKVDVFLTRFEGTITNLTNTDKLSKSLFANLTASAKVMGHADLKISAKINPYDKQPTFLLGAQVLNINLPTVNNFLEAYAKVNVKRGRFSVFTEVAASKGKFSGYVKPVMDDLKVLDLRQDIKKGPLHVLWQAAVGLVFNIVRNHKEDRVATRVPIYGEFKHTQVDVWQAILELLDNAFEKALLPALDHSIQLNSKVGQEVKLEDRVNNELKKHK